MKKIFFLFIFLVSITCFGNAQAAEKIKYGDFNSWVIRHIEESGVIGGNTKTLYEIGPNSTINGNSAYSNTGGSPWATSNVMAKVMGVTKGSNAVFRDTRGGNNYCARLSTIMEEVHALGIINMKVLVSGSIFLGKIMEPISSTKNPYSKMEMGVPFTRRPTYLVFDYKVTVPDSNRIYSSGFGSQKAVAGKDHAEVYIILQQRWEDKNGNIHAKRVGTGRERFGHTVANWINGHKIQVHYGDITNQPFFESYMGLIPHTNSYYAHNSKGKMVPVIEEGWAPANAVPTHMLIMASSGCGTAYVGTPGMSLWVDNISLEF